MKRRKTLNPFKNLVLDEHEQEIEDAFESGQFVFVKGSSGIDRLLDDKKILDSLIGSVVKYEDPTEPVDVWSEDSLVAVSTGC